MRDQMIVSEDSHFTGDFDKGQVLTGPLWA